MKANSVHVSAGLERDTLEIAQETISSVHIPAENIAHTKEDNSGEGKLALDILETEKDLIFVAPMAGVDSKKINVLVTEDILTISGERLFPEKMLEDERTPFLEECYWGKFSRSVVLPAAVNSDDVSAKFANGILVVHIPKAKKAKSKIVPIQVV